MPVKKSVRKKSISETICGGELPKVKSLLDRMEEELHLIDDSLDCIENNGGPECLPPAKKKPAKKKSKK